MAGLASATGFLVLPEQTNYSAASLASYAVIDAAANCETNSERQAETLTHRFRTRD